jgi:hypothetical protein
MKCDKAQELFSDYCEGSLQRAMTVTLESHLGECAKCSRELTGLKHVWSTLDAAPLIEPPVSFRETVWAKIEEAERQAARPRRVGAGFSLRALFTKRNLAWAGAALILLVLVPFKIPGTHSPAGLGLWGDLFYSHNSKAWAVTALPAFMSSNDPQVIVLPLTSDSPEQLHLTLKVISGPAKLLKDAEYASVKNRQVQNVGLRLLPDAAGKQIVVQAEWTQNNEHHSKVLPFMPP